MLYKISSQDGQFAGMLAGGDNNFGDFEDAFADGATTPASLPTLVGASRSSPAPSDLSLGSDADRFDLAFAEVDGRDSAAFHEQVFSDIAGDLQGLEAFQDACDDGLGPAEGEDAAAGDDPDPGPDGQGSVEVADAIPDDALEMFFCKWDECVAPAVGDRLRKRDADGQLVKQSDTRSHPGTRTDNNMLRLCFLRFAPKGATAAHDDYNSAQMLIREVALCKQAGFVMAIYAAIQQHKGTPSGGKWMFWSRRNDESHFDVAFSPDEAAIWVLWQLQRLEYDSLLEPEDVEAISKVITSRQAGTVHLLAQDARIRWAPGEGDDAKFDFIIPPCAVQRTSASNLELACDRIPGQCLDFRHVRDRVMPYLDFGLIHTITDKGSGPVRWTRKVRALFTMVMNVAVFCIFCGGHIIGTAAGGSIDDVMTFLQRWSNLMRFHDQYTGWISAMCVQATSIVKGTLGCKLIEGDDYLTDAISPSPPPLAACPKSPSPTHPSPTCPPHPHPRSPCELSTLVPSP